MYVHTPALVLSSEPLAENDRIITLYTKTLGKVRVVAKGARRALSKINPHLQPGKEIEVVLTRGQQWWRLTAAESKQLQKKEVSFETWWQLLSWYRFWGRVLKEEMAEEEIWQVCADFQRSWWEADESTRQLLYLVATLQLLYHLGYAPRWQSCGSCQAAVEISPELFYSWQGGVVCGRCPQVTGTVVPIAVAKLCRYFIEQQARNELNMVLPNETVVIIPEEELEKTVNLYKKVEPPKVPNYLKWLKLLWP